MPDMKDLVNVQLVIAFIVPGLIITYVRSRFIAGRMEKMSDAILAYLSLTFVYYGITLPLITYIFVLPAGMLKILSWWLLIAVGPAFFGMLLGVGAQYGWVRRIAHKLGMRPVHSTPNSWDWRFSRCAGQQFIMVTMADGSTATGIFGALSFASSDPSERDIYIEELWDVPDNGSVWTRQEPRRGILIPAKEIRYVNFWND
ncbi:DUF6338 family protein [Methylobacterium sp. CM6247]